MSPTAAAAAADTTTITTEVSTDGNGASTMPSARPSAEGSLVAVGTTVGTAVGTAVGKLVEARTAPQRRTHVHVECPASGAAAGAAAAPARRTSARRHRGRGRGRVREAAPGGAHDSAADVDEGAQDDAALNATSVCSADGLPIWSYMAGAEYLKFVRAIASRLRLGSGDALLDLAAGDCGASSLAIQQLYRGRLKSLAILPTEGSVHLFRQALHARSTLGTPQGQLQGQLLQGQFAPQVNTCVASASRHARAHYDAPLSTPQVNTCVASASRLDWLPPNSFDAAITFGAFSMLRSRARLCSSYRAVLHTLRPGGRFVIADVEHPDRCSRPSSSSGPSSSSLAEAASLNGQPDECASCHWRVSVPLAFWIACTPMDLEVTVSTVEHTDLPGTSTYPCASRHFALLAQRASTPHEVRATIEASSEESKASKVAVLLSLSASDTVDGEFQQRVQYLKEASIDNKRMYCGLHGYSLVIGEELHHARDRWASRLPCGLP